MFVCVHDNLVVQLNKSQQKSIDDIMTILAM